MSSPSNQPAPHRQQADISAGQPPITETEFKQASLSKGAEIFQSGISSSPTEFTPRALIKARYPSLANVEEMYGATIGGDISILKLRPGQGEDIIALCKERGMRPPEIEGRTLNFRDDRTTRDKVLFLVGVASVEDIARDPAFRVVEDSRPMAILKSVIGLFSKATAQPVLSYREVAEDMLAIHNHARRVNYLHDWFHELVTNVGGGMGASAIAGEQLKKHLDTLTSMELLGGKDLENWETALRSCQRKIG